MRRQNRTLNLSDGREQRAELPANRSRRRRQNPSDVCVFPSNLAPRYTGCQQSGSPTSEQRRKCRGPSKRDAITTNSRDAPGSCRPWLSIGSPHLSSACICIYGNGWSVVPTKLGAEPQSRAGRHLWRQIASRADQGLLSSARRRDVPESAGPLNPVCNSRAENGQ